MNERTFPRIQRLARVLKLICTACLILMPAFFIYAIATGLAGEPALQREFADYVLPSVVPTWTLILVRAIQAVSVPLIFYVLWQMRGLFSLYLDGETISDRCATRIRHCGQGLIYIGLAGVLSNTVIVLLLTMVNETGPQTVVITFSQGDIGFFLGGGLIVVIGWVMGEAARIAEDNRGFI